jgi:hypothetical protein
MIRFGFHVLVYQDTIKGDYFTSHLVKCTASRQIGLPSSAQKGKAQGSKWAALQPVRSGRGLHFRCTGPTDLAPPR